MTEIIHTPIVDIVCIPRGYKLSSKLARKIRKNPERYMIDDENRFSEEDYNKFLKKFSEPYFVKHIYDYLTKEVKVEDNFLSEYSKIFNSNEHKESVLKQLNNTKITNE